MVLPILLSGERPNSVESIYKNYACQVILEAVLVREGTERIFPTFGSLSPNKVDEGKRSGQNKGVLKHGVCETPAVIKLQNRFYGSR